jgi:hypothetical protein
MNVAVAVEKVTKIIAIKRFFDFDNATTMKEVKALKAASEETYNWFATECAKALGVELSENTVG